MNLADSKPAGGALSNPTEQYPRVFGKIGLFKEYPYALPSLVSGSIALSAALVSALFVEEVRWLSQGCI